MEGPDDKGEAGYKIMLHGTCTICTGMLSSYKHAARLASSYSRCIYACVLVASYPGPCGLGLRLVVLVSLWRLIITSLDKVFALHWVHLALFPGLIPRPFFNDLGMRLGVHQKCIIREPLEASF